MNYQKFKIEELLKDKTFHNWVNQSKQVDVDYWNSYLSANPHSADLIFEASRIIKGISVKERKYPVDRMQNNWIDLNNRIESKEKLRVVSRKKNYIKLYAAAGAITLIIILTVFLLVKPNSENAYSTVNHQNKKLDLSEEVKVILFPNSQISFNNLPQKQLTEVFLKGEAKFIFQATGKKWIYKFDTSFNITADNGKANFSINNRKGLIKVKVLSGRVVIDEMTNKSLELIAGEEAKLEKGSYVFVKKNSVPQINSV